MFSRFFRFLKIAWRLSGNLPWVGDPNWESTDYIALRNFLVTKEGKRFRMILLNMVLRQNAQAVSTKKGHEFNAGFANGFKGAVSSIESLASTRLYEGSEEDEPSDLEI